MAYHRDVRAEFLHGRLITRFFAPRIVSAGLLLTACAATVGLFGANVAHFWAALVLLGLGWNFGFVGASAMVLDCHRPEERSRVQSFNDFAVFGTISVGPFSSGGLLIAYGWNTVLAVSLVPAALAITILMLTSKPSTRTTA